jgi:hypothetical protein
MEEAFIFGIQERRNFPIKVKDSIRRLKIFGVHRLKNRGEEASISFRVYLPPFKAYQNLI